MPRKEGETQVHKKHNYLGLRDKAHDSRGGQRHQKSPDLCDVINEGNMKLQCIFLVFKKNFIAYYTQPSMFNTYVATTMCLHGICFIAKSKICISQRREH